MTKIEELEQKLNECQKELAELKESKKDNSGKWKPTKGEYYWFRGTDCDYLGRQNKDAYDEWRINNLPIFKTDQECKKYWRFMDAVKEKSYEFSREDWNDTNTTQYTIAYNNKLNELHVSSLINTKYLGEIYFRTREDAQYIIDNFKEELMEYWL